MGPMECFDVIRSLLEVRAAMKMMHPFDFKDKVYGGAVCSFRAGH